MALMSFFDVFEITEQTVREHHCSDYGKQPFQIMGIVYNPLLRKYYSTVDVNGVKPIHFEINDRRIVPGKKLSAKKTDHVFGGADPPIKWENPDYKPFQSVKLSLQSTNYKGHMGNGRLCGQGVLTLPDGSQRMCRFRVEIQNGCDSPCGDL